MKLGLFWRGLTAKQCWVCTSTYPHDSEKGGTYFLSTKNLVTPGVLVGVLGYALGTFIGTVLFKYGSAWLN